ncbi:MAG: DUF6268 family outer membrane beta-barrel protein [Flavobacterium circumlabens]|uniref:DUF6268 domain-containing protein n=1 Tax=Flavobacterium circumlabens TaxID=2133765 RepID=A0A4Y7UGZ7_9FLAO|nr:DUF6268 family outer membrane beta-barrel protein [Flavobacterium circumlabens]TCN60475.1 hypothetical protein EV142_10141 [Flavobacterium circumlabens]TEB45636.1 hypothetical protein D0809_01110 [Flavobacterium circumlabens]
MKIRLLIGSLFLISFYNVKAQENFSAAINVKTEPTAKIDFNETNAVLSFHKKISTAITVTNTLAYTNLKVNYELGSFKSFESLDNFNRLQNKFEITHDFSSTTKLNVAVTPTVNFQQNLDASDFSVLGSLEIRQQLNSKTSINVGAARTTIFGSPKFIPTLSLLYAVNDKSALLIGFPDSRLSYSNNIRNTFSLTNTFNGSFYHLDHLIATTDNASKVTMSQITSALEYERNVDKNWFINLKAGYDFNKKYNLIDDDNHKVYDFNTGKGYILGIGIKYKQ